MNNHPLNLAVRFLLELAALAAMGLWAYYRFDGISRWIAVWLIPLSAAVIWAVFRVDGDPGPAPVAIPGWGRLCLEMVFFCTAAWMLHATGYRLSSIIFAALLFIHYLVSYDRVIRLLQH